VDFFTLWTKRRPYLLLSCRKVNSEEAIKIGLADEEKPAQDAVPRISFGIQWLNKKQTHPLSYSSSDTHNQKFRPLPGLGTGKIALLKFIYKYSSIQ